MRKQSHLVHHVFLTVAVSAVTSTLLSMAIVPGAQLLGQQLPHLSTSPSDNDNDNDDEGRPSSKSSHSSKSSKSRQSSRSAATGGAIGTGTAQGATGVGTNSGTGNGNVCVLTISNCTPGDVTCVADPILQNVSCSDTRCQLEGSSCAAAGTTASTASRTTTGNDSAGRTPQTTAAPVPPLPTVNPDGTRPNTDDTGRQLPGTDGQTTGVAQGCFTHDGVWTTNRDACDTDQSVHFEDMVNIRSGSNTSARTMPTLSDDNATPPTSDTPAGSSTVPHEIQNDLQNQELQMHLQEKFHTQEELVAATTNLLNTATNSLQRLQSIPQQNLPVEASAGIADTSNWLTQLISDLSTQQPTLAEVQSKAGELKGRLQDTMQSVAKAMPTVQRKPETIIGKMDRLLATIPTVLAFMQEQGVPMSDDAVSEYQAAGSLYSEIKPSCLSDADECLKLHDVLTHLESMRNALESALDQAGKSDLKPRIDQMLQ